MGGLPMPSDASLIGTAGFLGISSENPSGSLSGGSTGSRAVDYISQMEHGVLVVVGSGKQGKSCSLHSLIAMCFPDRPKCIMDPLFYDVRMFPGYRHASEPGDVRIGSVCIIEDVNRVFNSRGSSRNQLLQEWLGIISHKSILVAITTQSMAGTDMEFLRSQDAIAIHKRMHSEDIAFERPEFATNQVMANEWISRACIRHPQVEPRAWCFLPRFNECVSIPKVNWWGYANSHMLRGARI